MSMCTCVSVCVRLCLCKWCKLLIVMWQIYFLKSWRVKYRQIKIALVDGAEVCQYFRLLQIARFTLVFNFVQLFRLIGWFLPMLQLKIIVLSPNLVYGACFGIKCARSLWQDYWRCYAGLVFVNSLLMSVTWFNSIMLAPPSHMSFPCGLIRKWQTSFAKVHWQ